MPAAGALNKTEYGKAQILKMTGTASYPTGGYDLPASVVSAVLNSSTPALGINDGQANYPLVAAGKVKFMVQATGLEVANAVNMSAVTLSILVP